MDSQWNGLHCLCRFLDNRKLKMHQICDATEKQSLIIDHLRNRLNFDLNKSRQKSSQLERASQNYCEML